jgi:hypothetical protein
MQRGGVRYGQHRGVNGGALARSRQMGLQHLLRSEVGVREKTISGTGLVVWRLVRLPVVLSTQ